MDAGFRIKQRRKILGLTLEDVGNYIGVNKATVQRYESGNINIKCDIAIKLSEILRTTPSYIMGWDEPELIPQQKKHNEEIALKLKQARINANMTQRMVADMLGMTYQAISNYERGKTKVECYILIKLCKIYNISITDILSDISLNQGIESLIPITCFEKETAQNQDIRLQEITLYYNDMSDEGKNLLLKQAQFYCQQFPKP